MSKAENKPIKPETAVAASVGFDPKNVKVVKNVTLPILKKEDGKPIYFKATGKIYTGKKTKDANGKEQEPAELLHVVNLETGQEMMIVCNKVLEETLKEEYPNDGYVNKAFMVVQSKVEGKRYKNYTISEIEA